MKKVITGIPIAEEIFDTQTSQGKECEVVSQGQNGKVIIQLREAVIGLFQDMYMI
ncbi:MAG TPA: hypothetical protein P5244_15750 [Syntrophales bacterium]|nr:hypothetical protein [Syntrophales bacterium]